MPLTEVKAMIVVKICYNVKFTVSLQHIFPRVQAFLFVPQYQFAVLQRRPWASSLLQEHHVLVKGEIKCPENKD